MLRAVCGQTASSALVRLLCNSARPELEIFWYENGKFLADASHAYKYTRAQLQTAAHHHLLLVYNHIAMHLGAFVCKANRLYIKCPLV